MANQPIHQTKICTKCGVEKPRTLEFYHYCNGYPRPYCRPCWRERENEYFHANREAKREAAKRKWAKTDPAIAAEKLKAWKLANPDKQKAIEERRSAKIKADPSLRAKARERVKRHRERLGPEEYNRRQRDARLKRPEASREHSLRWRLANVEKARDGYRRYREANPEKVIAHSEKRRARLLEAEGEFTGHDVIALVKAHGRICYYCESKLKKFEVDHFIPLSRGGSNWPSNLVISCRACNLSKAAKMPWEWQPNRFREGQGPR